MVSEWDAESAIRQAYLANVVVYRCVQILAETVASLPFRAGRNPDDPHDFDLDAPLARLLGPPPGGPNPDTPPSALWSNAVAQYLVTGRFGWELEWSDTVGRSDVVALWPLVSQYLFPVPAERGNRFFAGFEYRINAGNPISLRPETCYYDWRPSLTDWHQPESALQAARLDISVAVMQDVYDHAFLKNDARPAGLMVTRAFENEEQYEAFGDKLNARYGGPHNAGKTMVVEAEGDADGKVQGAIDYISLGISQRDADFFRRYEQKIRGICMALGVPMSKLDASGRTFDNAEAEDRTFETNTVIPLVTHLQESINLRLAPLVGNEVGWFDLSGLKTRQKKQAYTPVSPIELFTVGGISLNELRDAVGEEAVDGGDDIKALAPEPEPPALPAAEPPAEDPVPDPEPEPEPERSLPVTAVAHWLPSTKGLDDFGRSLDESEVDLVAKAEARRSRIWRSVDRQVTMMETVWERAMQSLFRRQEEATVDRLKGKRGRQLMAREPGVTPDANAIFSPEFWVITTAESVADLYRAVMALSASRAIAQFEVEFQLTNAYVEDFIRARSNTLAGHVTDTTYRAIQEELVEGVLEGEGIDKIERRVRGVFGEASKVRATTIARTEVIGAYNASTHQVGLNLPDTIVAGQEWISTRDTRTRDAHAAADGQVVRIGEKFAVGGYSMAYPGDSSAPASMVVRCRCTTALLTPDEMVERARRPQRWRSVAEVTAELVRIATGASA